MQGLWISLLVAGAFPVVLFAVRRLGAALGLDAEIQRKAVHICTGLVALSLPWLLPSTAAFLLCMTLMLLLMLTIRARPRLRRFACALHGVERRSLGDIGFLLAVTALWLLADDQWLLYALPLAVLTLSDALAAITGTRWGRHAYAAPGGRKTWEGTAACFASAFAVILGMLWGGGFMPTAAAVTVALALALAAALVEATAWNGLDNLFLPVALHFLLDRALALQPPELPAATALTSLVCAAGLAAIAAGVFKSRRGGGRAAIREKGL